MKGGKMISYRRKLLFHVFSICLEPKNHMDQHQIERPALIKRCNQWVGIWLLFPDPKDLFS